MTDTVTLQRSVVEQALQSLHLGIAMYPNGGTAAVTIQATIDALRAALERPHDHPEQHLDMVPVGWKLVPVEPTIRQMAAMGPAIRACYNMDGVSGNVVDVYRAMLAAAPQPPAVNDSLTIEQPQSVTICHQLQPQGEQPTMTPVAQRKLDDLLTRGYQISGYSVYHDTRHQHGFVTTAGLVGWWKPEGAEYPQPQGKAVGWLPLDCRGGYNFQQPQVEQEPVAWMWSSNDGTPSSVTFGGPNSNTPKDWIVQPLYTHPQNLNCKSTQARLATLWGYEKPQPKREPLTDDAATRLVQSVVAGSDRPIGMVAFGLLVARSTERAHGIGGAA